MNRVIYTVLSLFLMPLMSIGQVETIYYENFSTVTDGTGYGPGSAGTPVTIGQGEADLNGATLHPIFGRFSVSSTAMEKHLSTNSIISGGPVIWKTDPIDISCYSDISLELDIMGSSTLNETESNIGGIIDEADFIAVDITLVDIDETYPDLFVQYGSFDRQNFALTPPFLNICGNPLFEQVIFTVRFQSDRTFESHSLYSLRVTGESTMPGNISYMVDCESGLDLQVEATSGCLPEYSLDGINYNTTGLFEDVMPNTNYTVFVRDQFFPSCISTLDIAVTDCPEVLPIELLTFTATPQGKNILLQWTTATELNNDFMAVEHSLDGIQFREIGSVAGAGTTQSPQHYQFLDRRAAEGINYYRLRQVDFDGTFTFHPIITVELAGQETAAAGIRLFPTMASEKIRVELGFRAEGKVPYQIFTLTGQLIHSGQIDPQAEFLELPVGEFPSGAYLFSAEHLDRRYTARFFRHEN